MYHQCGLPSVIFVLTLTCTTKYGSRLKKYVLGRKQEGVQVIENVIKSRENIKEGLGLPKHTITRLQMTCGLSTSFMWLQNARLSPSTSQAIFETQK